VHAAEKVCGAQKPSAASDKKLAALERTVADLSAALKAPSPPPVPPPPPPLMDFMNTPPHGEATPPVAACAVPPPAGLGAVPVV